MIIYPLIDSSAIVVGLGQNADGFISDVEVLDVNDPNKSCRLPNFPYSAAGANGFERYGIFCGGHNSTEFSRECYYTEDGNTWTKGPDMREERQVFSVVLF